MNLNGKTWHTKMGIASCVIGVVSWGYFITIVLLLFYTDLSKSVNFTIWKLDGHVSGFEGMLEAILLLIFLFVVLPILGFSTGSVLGLAGSVQQKRRRLFGIIGLCLNALYFLFVGIAVIGLGVSNRN